MHSPRPLPKMRLCGDLLPWVNQVLHIGNTLTNCENILEQDMRIKNARYVSKNIEINQEFYFAAPETRLIINDIYNNSWFGSVVWDLFCPAAVKLESSWNRSIKITMDLPYGTHRGLIEPLSGRKHLKRTFMKRFLQMICKIRSSSKTILPTLLSAIELDTRSSTGNNLREIMLLTDKLSIFDITPEDADHFTYFPRPEEDIWKIEVIQCLLE